MDDEAEAGAPSASPRELMAGAGALILAAGGHGPCRAAGAAGADPVAAHALPIRSIEPDDEDYEDLKAFGDDVGDARIVQLGERSHGAGVDFKAKVRLIKFLHTRLGFDVLVWESGLHGMRGVNAGFRAGLDPVAAAQRGVFTIWSATAEVRPLFDYAKASQGSARALEMAGFDCQFTARGASQALATSAYAVSQPAMRSNAGRAIQAEGGRGDRRRSSAGPARAAAQDISALELLRAHRRRQQFAGVNSARTLQEQIPARSRPFVVPGHAPSDGRRRGRRRGQILADQLLPDVVIDAAVAGAVGIRRPCAKAQG